MDSRKLSLSLIIEGVLSRHLDGAYRNIAAELENALEAALAQQAQDEEIRPLSLNDSPEFKDGFNQGVARARDYVKRKLAQQETDITQLAGWCALCEEPNGCPHGHSEEEWIAANHRMIEQRRAALAQQAQPKCSQQCPHRWFAKNECGDLCSGWQDPFSQQAQPDDVERAARALQAANPWWHGQETVWQDFRPEAKIVIEALSRDRMAQQAQPEMPTREMIARAIFFSDEGYEPNYESATYLNNADTVLALFAPKETTHTDSCAYVAYSGVRCSMAKAYHETPEWRERQRKSVLGLHDFISPDNA